MTYQPLNIVPGPTYTATDQYVVIDPTGPNHIHVRGGGVIDNCAADVYLGGEDNNFMVSDSGGTANIDALNGVYFVTDAPIYHGTSTQITITDSPAVVTATSLDINLGDEASYTGYKLIIVAKDTITGDVETYEHLIVQGGVGGVSEVSGSSVQAPTPGTFLTTPSTAIVSSDVICSITNSAVSTNDVSITVQATAIHITV